MQLKENRTIADTKCNCKGGMGYCKHAAAVCIYVNTENAYSKTDQPMIWNKPSAKQLEKYQKGCKINSLFPNKSSPIIINKNVPQLSDLHMSNVCPLTEIIEAEKKYEAQRQEIEKRELEKLQELTQLLDKLYILQNNFLNQHNSYIILNCSDNKLKLKKQNCPTEYLAQYSLIKVDKEKWKDICIKSVGQSESSSWFRERKLRITCSSKAHSIKTRKDNFEKLASEFINQKYKGKMTADMIYGIKMEPVAASCFEEKTGAQIYHVGLVVCIKQPFLACSPDGIIENNGNLELLEIKCPSSCANSKIVNLEENSSNVPYLIFKKGNLQLKESHKYFTQVQVSMYILGIKLCHFVAYSSQDFVHILVHRDEDFLMNVIPKIELFYYTYVIGLLPAPTVS